MDSDSQKIIEYLEEKNKLLHKIITLQDEVDHLNKQVHELTEEVERLRHSANNTETSSCVISSESKGIQKLPGKKDTTKYSFDGVIYKKNRLVLAVIKKYVELNEGISAEELMQVFPKSLQGPLGTVRFVTEVKTTYSECEKRFFMDNHELIETPTGTVTICSQWHAANIDKFINCAQKIGLQIQIL